MLHISTRTRTLHVTCTTYLLNAVHMYMYICTVQYRTVPYGTVLYMYYGTVRYSTSELNLVHVLDSTSELNLVHVHVPEGT